MKNQKNHFVQTISQNQGIIKSLCKSYYTALDDQKDAFQDIVLQLWKSFNSFRGESAISTWIYRVSLNTLLSKKKKEQKGIIKETLEKVITVAQSVGTDDNLELLSMIIQSLGDQDKAIVILHLEGYKNQEIANMLNISLTNVSTRMSRVRTSLKKKYKHIEHEIK